METVKQNGWALEYADESLKKDKEIVIEAVKQNGRALEFADLSLKKGKEIVMEAVKQDGALEFLQRPPSKSNQPPKSTISPTNLIPPGSLCPKLNLLFMFSRPSTPQQSNQRSLSGNGYNQIEGIVLMELNS